MDLFAKEEKTQAKPQPLAVRMRPRTLAEFVGQSHILGEGELLPRAIQADRLSSLILYGPPGVGKTSLAQVISLITKSRFVSINAILSNVEELRRILARARQEAASGARTILFVDEIHRFNKAQQDVLIQDVEEGNIILIGATVHNPFFSLVSPLLSRSLVFELKSLGEKEILTILHNALKDKERGLGALGVKADKPALEFLARICEGDARRALNALELAALTTKPSKAGGIHISLSIAEASIQKKAIVYDHDEDAHYDTISSFIKSVRGSDPDAALYWLAKMLYAGEDPMFIARRLCILAAEDIGNADPLALVLVASTKEICEFVGMPECRIVLAQATTYLACAPKSNASYLGIEEAGKDVEKGRSLPVLDHLKDASYPGAEKLGHGQGYKYAHKYPGHYIEQDYLGESRTYYRPTDIGYEKKIAERMKGLKGKKKNQDTA